jgi:hypothetical protein
VGHLSRPESKHIRVAGALVSAEEPPAGTGSVLGSALLHQFVEGQLREYIGGSESSEHRIGSCHGSSIKYEFVSRVTLQGRVQIHYISRWVELGGDTHFCLL